MTVIAMPASVRLRHIEWRLDRPAQINVSAYTGARKVVANPWHGKWTAKVELAQIQGEANVLAWRSFFAQLKGRVNTFRLYATEAAQNANIGVVVSTTAAQGATVVTAVGVTTNLIAGQLVTINGQLLQLFDVNVPTAGTNTLSFQPPLRVAATAGTTIVTSQPYALVCLSDSAFGWSLDPARMYGIAFEVEEAIGDTDASPAPETLFTPVSITTEVWYDPSDLSTLFQDSAGTTPVTASGQPVGKMLDKSGNNRHLTQATSTKRPIYTVAGGLSYLVFDGVDDYLTSGSFSFAAPFIRSTAIKQVAWTSGRVLWDNVIAGAQQLVLAQLGSSPALVMYNAGAGASNAGAAVGVGAVARELWTSASGTSLTVNNGTPTTNALNGPATCVGLTIGADVNAANASSINFYGAVTIPGSTPNTQVDTYLGTKAGITI